MTTYAPDAGAPALEPTLEAGARGGHAGRQFLTRRRLRIAGVAVVVAALSTESAVLAPYVADGVVRLDRADLGWIVVAIAAEVASMITFARLQRVFLATGGVQVRLRSAVASVFAGNAMSVTLPGGSIASLAYTSRRMRRWGASSALTAFSLTATGILSAIGLALIGVLGSGLRADVGHLVWLGVELVALIGASAGLLALARHPAWIRRLLPGRRCATAPRRGALERLLEELAVLHPSALVWTRGLAFAVLNWAADLVCLLAAVHAVGAEPRYSVVVLAYVAGMAAASSIPLLPAGLGVVDAALVLALHDGGVPVSLATAGVLLYRLISLGLVAVTGWLVLLVARRRSPV